MSAMKLDPRRSFTLPDVPPDLMDASATTAAGTSRRVQLGDAARNAGFCGNKIRTSKYTPVTFLPVNIVEQFHKFGNLYFLIVSVLMWLGENTPLFVGTIKAFSTLSTLLMMMAVSGLVAWLDDRRRVAADVETNSQEARRVASGGALEKRPWEHVAVGDLLVVRDGEEFPADMVALYLSGHDGGGYVSTANLDGETNLKLKAAAPAAQKRLEGSASSEQALLAAARRLKGGVEAEPPQANIHDFKGRLEVGEDSEALDAKNLMLRGTRLRNTALCCGVVVYTGPDTRVVRNSREAPLKQSNLEVVTNRVMLVLLAAQGGIAFLSMILYQLNKAQLQEQWYLVLPEIWLPDWLAYWLTFFVLYSNMMPISLYPTMEWCNSFHTLFIKNDAKMFWPELDFPANARSSNLCQELGQVRYIFSDKTGTLTQNIMELKRFWVAGRVYGEMTKARGFSGAEEVLAARASENGADVDRLLEVLSVAHTAVLSDSAGRGEASLEGESPDEIALVETAGILGWRFSGRRGTRTSVAVGDPHGGGDEPRDYEIRAVNAFDSARKRMSALVERDGSFFLFAKGADNVMLERSSLGGGAAVIEQALHDFATEGLRTLVIGGKEVPAPQAEEWLARYRQAQQCMDDRDGALAEAAEAIEVELEVYGITAIEDKLQDFVPETITKLRSAGIKLWVLTGDKLETAKNIGYSSKVLLPKATVVELDADPGSRGEAAAAALMDRLEAGRRQLEQAEPHYRAVMVTGAALGQILEEPGRVQTFLSVMDTCAVVIACRVSPLQKAQVVRMVREGITPSPVTLAVGDGANDVPMIQEAQVGVGIAGREGRQAVNNSDFAIGQFCFLQRLILVHGRWNYRRACKFTLFTFWRNSVQVLLIFYYTFACGYSGTVLFEDWVRLSFNFLCSFPIMATGCFDQDITDSTALQNPWTYVFGREGLDLNVKSILESLALAVVHSLLIAVVLVYAYPSFELLGAGDYYTFGTVGYICLVVQMNYRVAFINHTHNRYTVGALLFSFACLALYLIIYPCTRLFTEFLTTNMYMTTWHYISIWPFYLLLFVLPMLALAVDSLWLVAKRRLDVSGAEFDQLRRTSYRDLCRSGALLPGRPSIQMLKGWLVEVPPDVCDSEAGGVQPGDSLMEGARTSDQVNLSEMWQQSRRGVRVSLDRWQVRFSPLVCFGVLMATGLIVLTSCSGLQQLQLPYGGPRSSSVPLGSAADEVAPQQQHCDGAGACTFTVKVPRTLHHPIMVYYKVGPYFQNFNSYMKGEATNELMGRTGSKVTQRRETRCPLETRRRDGQDIVPCGMMALSMFNDTISVAGVEISRRDIAWPSDRDRYSNPEDYLQRPNTRWLNDTYPGVVPVEEGVKYEPFIVWMRPSVAPWITKPYGWIHEDLEKGRVLTVTVQSTYPVDPSKGYKLFALTEVGAFGGRDLGLGLCLALFGLFAAAIFLGALLLDLKPGGRPREDSIVELVSQRSQELASGRGAPLLAAGVEFRVQPPPPDGSSSRGLAPVAAPRTRLERASQESEFVGQAASLMSSDP